MNWPDVLINNIGCQLRMYKPSEIKTTFEHGMEVCVLKALTLSKKLYTECNRVQR